jgi:Ser/Thr protein kinase RdoA (MazF antagonist)
MAIDLFSIAEKFRLKGNVRNVFPYGSGHINDSYKILTNGPNYLLQRVNHEIFKDVRGLTSNIVKVTGYLADKISESEMGDKQLLSSVLTQNGNYLFIDDDANFWRVFDFIENSRSFDKAENEQMVFEGGKTYGWFIRMLDQFPAHTLVETIPDFHDIHFRLGNFNNAIKNDPAGRVNEVEDEIQFVLSRSEEMKLVDQLGKSGQIPLRVTHNDTKINNVLFNEDGEGICVIDLDTVMPGYVHFDFGDAIRTFTNTANEDEKDASKAGMNIAFFKAFAEGFLLETRDILKPEELETLAFSAKLMTYIIGLRFLTDYLDGDVYYKTAYPGHNLVRARVQFSLLESMEKQITEMEDIVRNASKS